MNINFYNLSIIIAIIKSSCCFKYWYNYKAFSFYNIQYWNLDILLFRFKYFTIYILKIYNL